MSEIAKSLRLLKNAVYKDDNRLMSAASCHYDFFIDMILDDFNKNRLNMLNLNLMIYGGFLVNYILNIPISNNIDLIINNTDNCKRAAYLRTKSNNIFNELIYDKLYWLFNMFYIFGDKIHYNISTNAEYSLSREVRQRRKKIFGMFNYYYNNRNFLLDFSCLLNCTVDKEPDFNINALQIDANGSIYVRSSRTNLSSIINSLRSKKVIPIYNYAFTVKEYNTHIKNGILENPGFIYKCINLALRELKIRDKGLEVINGLYQPAQHEAEICPICLDKGSKKSLVMLMCGHMVHLNCCYNYMNKSDSHMRWCCCICRNYLVFKNNVVDQSSDNLDADSLHFYSTLKYPTRGSGNNDSSTDASTITHTS